MHYLKIGILKLPFYSVKILPDNTFPTAGPRSPLLTLFNPAFQCETIKGNR